MKNNYIHNKDFYIRDDLSSLLLYYDFFSQGLSILNKYADSVLIRKSIYAILKGLIILIFFSKAYKLLYKNVLIEDDALIVIKRKGQWANTLRLINKNGQLIIIKKSFDSKAFTREKTFYEMYKNNSSKLRLLNHTFLDGNTIEIEFFKSKTLQRLVNEGSINFEQSIEHFNKIKNEINILYKSNKSLVHGDLWLTNIFINNGGYNLIDYTDSHIETIEYDLYVFLVSLLSSFRNFGTSREAPDFYIKKRVITSKLLNIDMDKVLELEKRYINFRSKKIANN